MKKIYTFVASLLFSVAAFGATFQYFNPAAGILKGNPSTYVTTAATSSDLLATFTGTCNSTTFMRGDGSCQTPPGAGGGTVNSVALSAPSVFSVTGSPITNTGTLALNFATGQTANSFLATPDGTTGALSLRTVVNGDLPTVNAAHGGTGVTTLTGIAKGNGTSAFSVAGSSDVISTWTGTCSASTFLRGDGSCQTPATGTGTVTSVALTVPSGFSVTGSPVTTSGTLAISGTLDPAAGGTGVATLTGIAKGNGTSAFSVAASGDVTGLWGGTCSSATYLRGDGTCQTPPTGGTSANPSATIGLTAINGSAGTFLRSDGAPALDQGIIPTWTGTHTFNNQITAAGGVNATGTVTASGVISGSNLNAFTAFSGPATSLKTFTLPNASSTILTSNAAVTVAQGGTGAATLTGYVKGSGTSALTASATIPYSDLTGTPTIPTAANPTGTIGLTAVNGSAGTFLRSDGAPALSQSITPTWTGNHQFNSQVSINTAAASQRALTITAPTASNIVASFNESLGVHAIVFRPNISPSGINGNQITSDFNSGSTYLPLILSGRGGADLVLGTSGNITANAASSGTTLTVNATNASTAGIDLASGQLRIGGSAGTTGQVWTSQGSGAAPIWSNVGTLSGSNTWTGNNTFAPSSGTPVTITGVSSGAGLIVNGSPGGTSSSANVYVTTSGSGDRDAFFMSDGTNSFSIRSNPGTTTAILRTGIRMTFNVNNIDQMTIRDGDIRMNNAATASATQTYAWCGDSNKQMIADTVACLVSARRFKDRIAPLDVGLAEVMKLQPVKFHYKKEFNGALQSDRNFNSEQVGFIADDVQKIDDRFVLTEKDGKTPHALRYENMVALLTKAIQEQQQQIDELRKELRKSKKH